MLWTLIDIWYTTNMNDEDKREDNNDDLGNWQLYLGIMLALSAAALLFGIWLGQ